MYFCHDVETVALVTSHLGGGFEHSKKGLWKVRRSVRSRSEILKRWAITTIMVQYSGFSAGRGSRDRESKIGEELHCHQRAEGGQSTKHCVAVPLILTVPNTFLIVMQKGKKMKKGHTGW